MSLTPGNLRWNERPYALFTCGADKHCFAEQLHNRHLRLLHRFGQHDTSWSGGICDDHLQRTLRW
jgi:hypothetical protein